MFTNNIGALREMLWLDWSFNCSQFLIKTTINLTCILIFKLFLILIQTYKKNYLFLKLHISIDVYILLMLDARSSMEAFLCEWVWLDSLLANLSGQQPSTGCFRNGNGIATFIKQAENNCYFTVI